jgi:phage shock protein E
MAHLRINATVMLSFLKSFFKPSANIRELVKQGAIVVDVRTPAEYKQGHIPGSINIPVDQVNKNLLLLQKKGVPVITVCQSGARSGMAKGIISKVGIDVYNGGSWRSVKSKLEQHV